MTKHDLKEMRNIGAELGAAKAEVERLREALRPFATFEAVRSKQGGCTPKRGTVWAVASAGEDAEITVEHLQAAVAALSQQAEPVRGPGTEDTASMDSNSAQEQFTAVDMATAAAQGFRDGQAAVEQATAQDERTAFEAWVMQHNTAVREDYDDTDENAPEDIRLDRQGGVYIWANAEAAWFAWKARSALDTRPAQTEQQPLFYINPFVIDELKGKRKPSPGGLTWSRTACGHWTFAVYAAPIAQTAQGAGDASA